MAQNKKTMKKITKFFVGLFLVTALFSCGNDDDGGKPTPPNVKSNGKYEVQLDGKVLIKNDRAYANITESITGVDGVTINSGITFFSSLPKSSTDVPKQSIAINKVHLLGVGETVDLTANSGKAEVSIVKDFATQEVYSIQKGTLTREAEDKFSFTATEIGYYKKGEGQKVLTEKLTGYVVSDVVKKVGKVDE